MGAAAAGGAAALAAGKSGSGRDYRKAGDDGARSATGEAIPDDDDHDSSSRLIPWAMVATVVLAVVLLGVGGYGVIKERSTLEANIRELQAQLATAVSSDEIAAEREQQRQLEREKQALESRLAALEAENAAMIETISALEARLESTSETVVSEPDEAVASAAPPAGDAPTRGAAGAAVAATGTGSGGWFVNFGSYARRADAERWAEKVRRFLRGMLDAGEVVVQSTEASGRTLHRVRVNGLASRDSAERVATALEREYGLPRLWVGRN